MRAVITLDDVEGEVGMTLFLEGGFQVDSNAHQTANLIVKHLDELASIRSKGDVKWVEGADAAWIADSVVAVPQVGEPALRLDSAAGVVLAKV